MTDNARAAAELTKRESEDRTTDALVEPCWCGNAAYAVIDNTPRCDLHIDTPEPEEDDR